MKQLIGLIMLGLATPAIAQDTRGETWTYIKQGVDLSTYKAILIRPTIVSDSPGAEFDGIPTEDRLKYATIMTDALAGEMPKSFKVVRMAEPGTVAVEITILGAKKTIGGVATATRVLPIGLAANAFKSLEGKPGTFTGSLLLEISVSDASNGEVLADAIRRRTPDPLAVEATLSTADTVKSISQDVATTLRTKLVNAKMPVQPN